MAVYEPTYIHIYRDAWICRYVGYAHTKNNVRVCVDLHTWTYLCISVYVYVYVCAYVYAYVNVGEYASVYPLCSGYVCPYAHTCMHIGILIYIYMCTCTGIRIRTLF